VTAILVSDTHLTDRPNDEYRWGLWPWLRDQVEKVQASEIIHLGDLTDAKDRHPARLVNRLVASAGIVTDLCRLYFLKGNHDYIDPLDPFFAFVGSHAKITYFKTSTVAELSIGKATFVPAGEKWNFQLHDFPFCFTHVTFDGAEAENGSLLPGVDPARLSDYKGMLYSGDIHVPQKVRKNIEYVGAPYHIRFGDTFTPRVLVVYNNGKTNELHYPAPRKCVFNLDSVKRLGTLIAEPGDHIRIRYHLRRSDYDTWHEIRERIRQYATDKGWVLFGVEAMPIETTTKHGNTKAEFLTLDQLFDDYAKRHKLNEEYIKIGRELLGG
jgi:predicted phosphodiesterase